VAVELSQKVYSVEQSSRVWLAAVISKRISGRFLPGEKTRTDGTPGGVATPVCRTWSGPPLATDSQPVTGSVDSEALSGGKGGHYGRQHAAPLGRSPEGAQYLRPGPSYPFARRGSPIGGESGWSNSLVVVVTTTYSQTACAWWAAYAQPRFCRQHWQRKSHNPVGISRSGLIVGPNHVQVHAAGLAEVGVVR
jgi:hypothetical protein